MSLGFVFPGQGAQFVGMGKEIYQHYPEARRVFATADEVLGYPLSQVCFEGPQSELDRTEVTQPAILTVSIAVYSVLAARGFLPSMGAGLSLGEYSALVAADALDLAEALRLVRLRGALMQEAVPPGQGAMAAVIGMDTKIVEDVLAGQQGVSIANYNYPGQVVLSGETKAVEAAGQMLRNQGGRVVPLAVSIPSHCLLMKPAADKFAEALGKVAFREPRFPVISNATAERSSGSVLADILARQMYSPVRWEETMKLILQSTDYVVEVGPGTVLTGFFKKLDRNRCLGSAGTLDSLELIMARLEVL